MVSKSVSLDFQYLIINFYFLIILAVINLNVLNKIILPKQFPLILISVLIQIIPLLQLLQLNNLSDVYLYPYLFKMVNLFMVRPLHHHLQHLLHHMEQLLMIQLYQDQDLQQIHQRHSIH